MAQAKKSTRKAATKRVTASNTTQPKAEFKIPSGFVQPETGFYDAHDFEKHPLIIGTIIDFRETTPKKKGDKAQKLMVVENSETGVKETVFHSHQLTGLFDACHIGDEVMIQFQGVKKLPGKKSLKLFETAYKSNAVKPTRKKK